ncbi:MAG: hypothetical protein Q3979_05195 [Actinomycetaceae bacterium]|nr:hypothetical protein [Actinomycetaceae bacterium]
MTKPFRRTIAFLGAIALAGSLTACGSNSSGGGGSGNSTAAQDVTSAAAEASASGTAVPFTGDLPVLGSQELQLKDEQVRVDLNAVRVTDEFTIVTFSVTKLSPDEDEYDNYSPGNAFDGVGNTTDGVTVIDGANKKVYEAARTEDGGCLCSSTTGQYIKSGETAIYYTTFARLPKDVEKVNVKIPSVPQVFEGVKVTR